MKWEEEQAMRSFAEASTLWETTIQASPDLASLRLHVRPEASRNPCLLGLRSVCWKTFLLFRNTDQSSWAAILADSRSAYTSLKEHFLKYIDKPQALGSALDPLDDDKNSPWNTLRRDEELRAEILQDVERCMPEEQYFRQALTQRVLLDVLFIYCKLNEDVGYRQGMHELLAPILWVVQQDAIDASRVPSEFPLQRDMLDASFIEHDSFTMFAQVMQKAKSFYELGEPQKRSSVRSLTGAEQTGSAPIVARSKQIHETFLAHADPELSAHLTDIEILPQIFLIRWIRLLFGREFPFKDLLALWDTLFAEDPDLDLVDLICVSMLLRIRWQLIEADYSTALALVLKYPIPDAENGPQTFVQDAVYLRDHLDNEGGKFLIVKYSGRAPSSEKASRISTPTLSPDRNIFRRRSPLPSAASFLKQQGGMEALLSGAAKGVLERGEKLGINQAVRDAMGEVKKNMQTLAAPPSHDRRSTDDSRWSLDDGRSMPSARRTVTAMETRNKQLAIMLEEALLDLRAISKSELPSSSSTDAVDLAIAKIQFVQVYLGDTSMPLPSQEHDKSTALRMPTMSRPSNTISKPTQDSLQEVVKQKAIQKPLPNDSMSKGQIRSSRDSVTITNQPAAEEPATDSQLVAANLVSRPQAPVPSRSTLAQSSFAWMLETEEEQTAAPATKPKVANTFTKSARRPTSGFNREKAAFLFGEETDELADSPRRPSIPTNPDEGFSLGTMKGPSKR